jgi:hypothetical protein
MGTEHDKFMAMLEALDAGESLEPTPVPPKNLDGDLGEQLDKLTGLAITRIRQVLEAEPNLADEKLTKLQATAAQSVLNTQVKVDDSRLKRQKLNVLPRLIEMIREEYARRAAEEAEHERQAAQAPVIDVTSSAKEREQKPPAILKLVRKR